MKDEKLERKYPEVRSDFSLKVVYKTLVYMFEGFFIDYEFDWATLINLCKTDFATR